MNLAIRQQLQQALEKAIAEKGTIVLERNNGDLVEIEPDLICYETQVEATAKDGAWVTIPYSDITAVRLA
jgi:hypothetical protein